MLTLSPASNIYARSVAPRPARGLGWTVPASLVLHGAGALLLLMWPDPPAVVLAPDAVTVELFFADAAPPGDGAGSSPQVAEESSQPEPPVAVAESAVSEPPVSEEPPPQEPPPEEPALQEPPAPEPTPAPDPVMVEPVLVEPPPPVTAAELTSMNPVPPPRPVRVRDKPRVVKIVAAPAASSTVRAKPMTTVSSRSGPPEPGLAAVSAPTAADGGGGAPPAATAAFPPDYLARLRGWLERHKRYPGEARLMRTEGVATVWFRMARDGTVQAWRIERSSGSPLLDAAVREMIESASPLPALPADVAGNSLELRVPVAFRLTR